MKGRDKMTAAIYSDVWDLDTFFLGGSESAEFQVYLMEVHKRIDSLSQAIHSWDVANNEEDREKITQILFLFQQAGVKIRQAGAYVSCLEAENTADTNAGPLRARVTELSADLNTSLLPFDQKLTKIKHDLWQAFLQTDELKEISFILNERREKAQEKLSQEEEAIIQSLSVDGYHGWGQMYDVVVGTMVIPFVENGAEQNLSVGQAANKFSHPDRNVRQAVFTKWEQAWQDKAPYFAKTLNHLAGFRLNIYKKRGWDDPLKEPLAINRMERNTLDAMWDVIAKNKAPFVKFLERKAELLGVEKLSWYDLDAPLGSAETKVSYQEGAEFIIEHFSQFGQEMKAFAEKAFENRWIEAEDRPSKKPGGFHTYFAESQESRIFMTYSGSASNVSTLAHELGHGFHTYAMKDLHFLNRNYSMNVAETASTFAEMIVADASVKNAKTDEEKLALLEDKIQRSVALLMNIHARFLFETRYYNERAKGMVSAERLNELMTEAQKEAYGHALDEYHPSFWSSKLHFYITGVPFYNFPYTFGYLFSLGIYAYAQEKGAAYEEQYIALLKDTASMKVEDLAKKHLQTDLTKPDFWEKAVQLCIDDVEEFLSLTQS